MKKLLIVLLLSLAFTFSAHAQLWVCGGSSVTLQAPGPGTLTSVTYSLNPGGLTSTSGSFVLTTTVYASYTLYTTGLDQNSNPVTITTQTNVNLTIAPLFSLGSPQNFTLGCSSKSLSVVQILNAQATPSFGGAVSYSLLMPWSGGVPVSGTLSGTNNYSITTPGTYTAVVRNNANDCSTYEPFQVTSNITTPVIDSVLSPVMNCTNTIVLLEAFSSSPNINYKWAIPPQYVYQASSTFAVVDVSAPPTVTSLGIYTVIVENNFNLCVATQTVNVLRNTFPPNAVVFSPVPGCATTSVQLSNMSSSTIPPSIFSNNGLVVSYLWQGPSPQFTFGPSSFIVASTPGVYTMNVMDTNNGCTSSATVNVNISSLVPAFTHTVSNGQVSFTDMTAGTNQSTSYLWNFGDGNFSTQQNPTHTYQYGGSHLVKLIVTNTFPSTCSHTIIQSVNVTGLACVANSNFTLSPTTTTLVWNAIPSYPWNVSAARWDWGDGSFSNLLFTSHTYSAPGNHNICLSVTVSCVASSSSCSTYSVYRSTQVANVIHVNVLDPVSATNLTESKTIEEFTWSIVPNPGNGLFNIHFSDIVGMHGSFSVNDLTGRKVYATELRFGDKEVVSLDGLSSGVYFITVRAGASYQTKKLVIEK